MEGGGYRLARILMAIMEEDGIDLWPEPEVIVALAEPAPTFSARARRGRRRR